MSLAGRLVRAVALRRRSGRRCPSSRPPCSTARRELLADREAVAVVGRPWRIDEFDLRFRVLGGDEDLVVVGAPARAEAPGGVRRARVVLRPWRPACTGQVGKGTSSGRAVPSPTSGLVRRVAVRRAEGCAGADGSVRARARRVDWSGDCVPCCCLLELARYRLSPPAQPPLRAEARRGRRRCWELACSPSIERTNGRVGEESIFDGASGSCCSMPVLPLCRRACEQGALNSFSCKPSAALKFGSAARRGLEIASLCSRSLRQLFPDSGSSATNSREDVSASLSGADPRRRLPRPTIPGRGPRPARSAIRA